MLQSPFFTNQGVVDRLGFQYSWKASMEPKQRPLKKMILQAPSRLYGLVLARVWAVCCFWPAVGSVGSVGSEEDTKDPGWGFARDMQWGQGLQLIEDFDLAQQGAVAKLRRISARLWGQTWPWVETVWGSHFGGGSVHHRF